jgi:hypothetical protein
LISFCTFENWIYQKGERDPLMDAGKQKEAALKTVARSKSWSADILSAVREHPARVF